MEYLGNRAILDHRKTAFLSSRQCPASVVLRCYDWAKAQRSAGTCVVCGNASQMERDVFNILLRGTQPLILVLARGMMSRWEPAMNEAIETGRLLVASPFPKSVVRITRDKAAVRNAAIITMSDEIVAAHITSGGQLDALLKEKTFKLIEVF